MAQAHITDVADEENRARGLGLVGAAFGLGFVIGPALGGALGISSSVESFTRVIGPAAGGFVLGALGTWAPGAIGAAIMAGVIVYVWRRLIVNPDPPLPTRGDKAPAEGAVQA